jgi:hypothetical protein
LNNLGMPQWIVAVLLSGVMIIVAIAVAVPATLALFLGFVARTTGPCASCHWNLRRWPIWAA